MHKKQTPRTVYAIAILTALTITRAQAGLFLPTLEMFGGESADAWLVPWITDTLLGVLLPLMIYLILRGSGAKTWSLIIIYSVVGAFDYVHGLVAQWQHPLPEEMASSALVFGSLLASLSFQLIAILLLFNANVISHYLKNE
ncbi:MAG: hypothetical protein AAGG75_09660 [Bacteroidota bacterium]